MTELALNILDVANNSTRANATTVKINVLVNTNADKLAITIQDDGCGMSEALLKSVADPFATTRTTRKVGMGVPLFKMAAEQAGGTFNIVSRVGKGTTVFATFMLSHVDRMPLGDVAATMTTLITGATQTDFVLNYAVNAKVYHFDTREVKRALGETNLGELVLISYIQDMIRENIEEVNGGIYL